MRRKKISKRLKAAEYMPPLRHSIPDEPFDIKESEVARWLCSQPDIMQYVFDEAHSKKLIKYEKNGFWRGVEWGPEA